VASATSFSPDPRPAAFRLGAPCLRETVLQRVEEQGLARRPNAGRPGKDRRGAIAAGAARRRRDGELRSPAAAVPTSLARPPHRFRPILCGGGVLRRKRSLLGFEADLRRSDIDGIASAIDWHQVTVDRSLTDEARWASRRPPKHRTGKSGISLQLPESA
jgi:hypothetical protein